MSKVNSNNNTNSLKKLKFKKYLSKIKNLMPEAVANDKLIITNEIIFDATGLVQEIASVMHDTFDKMCDSDFAAR